MTLRTGLMYQAVDLGKNYVKLYNSISKDWRSIDWCFHPEAVQKKVVSRQMQ